MEQVFSTTLKCYKGESAIEERKKLLDVNFVGITDMITMCYRINDSSPDHNIYPIKLNDILAILDEHPSIETII